MALELVTIPCLQDNYAYLLHDPVTRQTAVVDVPEVAPILKELLRREWMLTSIFLTHHHDDHIQGVDELRTVTGARVWGADADRHRLPRLDWSLWEGDEVQVGRAHGTVIDVPGHTRGHIAFHFPASGYAFTGDSLMSGGCGRLFEGTPDEMWSSLQKLAALPPETLICSGHEYTTSNLRFAATIEPQNPALAARIAAVATARTAGKPTVPVALAEELATNPMLRAALPAVKAALGLPDASDVAAFADVRARKDRF
ncbi:hydroxyacylglutathione hydrolase [Paracoccaceae bacterium]